MLYYISLLETEEQKIQFTEVYSRNRDKMYHIAFGFLRQREETENAVHDAFVKLADHFGRYENLSEREMDGLCMLDIQNEQEIRKLVRVMFDAELYSMEQNEKLREPAAFSAHFEKRMAGMIRRQRLGYQVKTAMKYILSAAAVFLIVFCLTNPGRAAKAWDALVKWYRYPKHMELHVNMPEEEKGKEIPEYELTYIPEGFTEGLSGYDGTEGFIDYFGAGYVQSADSLTQESITLVYSSFDAHVYYQEENEAVREKDEEGNEVFYIREGEDIRLVWYSEKDKLMFRLLTSGLTKEEAYQIKDGIRRKGAVLYDEGGNGAESFEGTGWDGVSSRRYCLSGVCVGCIRAF